MQDAEREGARHAPPGNDDGGIGELLAALGPIDDARVRPQRRPVGGARRLLVLAFGCVVAAVALLALGCGGDRRRRVRLRVPERGVERVPPPA